MTGAGVAIALLLGVAAAPLPQPASPAASDQARLVGTAIEDYQAALRRRDTDAAIRAVDVLHGPVLTYGAQALLLNLRGAALLVADRGKEADIAFAEADRLGLLGDSYIDRFAIGMRGPDSVRSYQSLIALIEHAPDAARRQPKDRIFRLIGRLSDQKHTAEVDQIYARLAALDYGGDDIDLRDSFYSGGAEALVKAGKVAEAGVLAARMLSPGRLADMMVDRAYTPLWPMLEAKVGDGFGAARAAAIASAEAWRLAAPDRPEAIGYAIDVYRIIGQREQAVAAGTGFAASPAEIQRLNEAGGWVVDSQAGALYEAGREDAADARYAQLETLDFPTHQWRISMVLNRIWKLVSHGRDEAALRLLPATERDTIKYGSPYAQVIVHRVAICALAGLGRTSEAQAPVAMLRQGAGNNRLAAVGGLLCLNRIDEAAAQLTAALDDVRFRHGAISLFQPQDSVFPERSARWEDRYAVLLSRADVKAAFDKVARRLPDRFRYTLPPLAAVPAPSL